MNLNNLELLKPGGALLKENTDRQKKSSVFGPFPGWPCPREEIRYNPAGCPSRLGGGTVERGPTEQDPRQAGRPELSPFLGVDTSGSTVVRCRCFTRSVHFMRKHIARRLLTASIVAALIAGCGGKKPVDPYPTVTIRQITRGRVASKGFRYKLVNPDIPALSGSLGLVRDGDILEVIGARGLEEELREKMDGDFALGVVKEFSPFVHFRVEKIFSAADTTYLPATEALPYPKIQNAAGFRTGAYEPFSIDGVQIERTDVLRSLENKRFSIKAPIARGSENGETRYFLLGGSAKFRVSEPSDGMRLFLELLTEKGYEFEGGVLMRETEEQSSRLRSRIAGTVEVDFIKYGSRIVSR